MAEENYLVVLTFQGAKTAAAMYTQLQELEKKHGVSIVDAVIIERGAGAAPGSTPLSSFVTVKAWPRQPARSTAPSGVIQTHGKKGKYAAGGAGIGLLAGFLLGGPIRQRLPVRHGFRLVTAAMKDRAGQRASDLREIKRMPARTARRCWRLVMYVNARPYIASLRTFDPYVVSTTLTPEVEEELRKRLAASQSSTEIP